MNNIKLMKNYVTNGVMKARVHYSHFTMTDGRECVTIYEKNYERNLSKIFDDAVNNSDLMTDYHEKTRVRIFPDNPLYSAALDRA